MTLRIVSSWAPDDFCKTKTGVFNFTYHEWVRSSIHRILDRTNFYRIPKGWKAIVRYKKWNPLVIQLWGNSSAKDWVTELILISTSDYREIYWIDLVTPYFLIHTDSLPLQTQLQWYKGVRMNEIIRLGLYSDADIASRLQFAHNPYISRHHMELELLDNGDFEIRDLWSTNWTFLTYHEKEESQTKQSIIEQNMKEIQQNQFLSRLWPNLSKGMKQWPVWNCYFVAAINSIKEHPNCVKLLTQIIQPHSQGYKVHFLWINQFTVITEQDITEMWDKKLQWSLGDHILERAYWRLRHDRYDPSLRWWFREQIHRTKWTVLAHDRSGYKVHEWWWMKHVLSDFLGPLIEKLESFDGIYSTSNSNVISQLNSDNLITASTPSVEKINRDALYNKKLFPLFFPESSQIYQEASTSMFGFWWKKSKEQVYENISRKIAMWQITGDKHLFTVLDINNSPQVFYFNHAYSVGYIDNSAWYIELINPHDTQYGRYYISIRSFYLYFDNLTLVKLRK